MSAGRAPNGLDPVSVRYQSLLAIIESIASHMNLTDLFEQLPDQLRVVVDFDAVAVALYDEQNDTMRLCVFETKKSLIEIPAIGESGPVDASPEGTVWRTQQAMLISPVTDEKHFPDYMAKVAAEGIETLYSIPLTASGRRLGAISFGSSRKHAYPDEDREFLDQVAKQVAVTIDSVLNLESAASERDHKQLLLEVGKAITSSLGLGDLLRAVSSCLRQFIKHDFASVVLCDEESGQLRVHGLDTPVTGLFAEGTLLPIEGTPVGFAITTRKTLWRDKIDFEEFYAPQMRIAYGGGLRSGVCVPLISHDQVLGGLNVGSNREAGFSADDVKLLEEIAGPVAIAVENALNFQRASHERDRKQLLLEVSNAIVTDLTPSVLLQTVSGYLRRFFNHDFASIILKDEPSGKLRIHALDAENAGALQGEGALLPFADTPVWLAITSRQTVRRDRLDMEEFKSPLVKHSYEVDGIRSILCVPLISQDQVLGTLNVVARREAAFTTADAELLEQIAHPVAIATQNSLNLVRAELERDRKRLLLDINNAVVTNLDLNDLLKAISGCLVKMFHHDAASLSLYEPKLHQFRMHTFDFNYQSTLQTGTLFPVEGTPAGRVLETRQTVRLPLVTSEEFPADIVRHALAEGLLSACSIPLIVHDEFLGVLEIASRRENAFTEYDAGLLKHIARQIAIATQNSLNFERAKRERERVRLLLEINNALVSSLDLNQVVKTVSATLREIMPHDAAGIALYDPEQHVLREYTNVTYKDMNAFHEGDIIPIDGTPAGDVFLSGEPMLIRRPNLEKYPQDRFSQLPLEDSPKSACLALLQSHGRKLGIAGVSSTQEERFTEEDVEFFNQISGQIALAVENSLQYREIEELKNKLTSEKLYLEEEIRTEHNFSEIVGQSAALKKILQQVATVAPTDSAVLLCGETGTGKELIARAIHDLSSRKERTLVKLNCAAIPTGLLESELFGHEKGAFTGAIASRIGRFELAHKGTLLLDEIGEIPLELQPKLLRVLQEQEFERLGSSRTVKTDVRLIAATNVDLPQMVADKKFRSDLYYRLNVFPIMIPPLRERIDDIPLLVGYFTQKHSLRMNKKIQTVGKGTIDALCEYSWPGNVRELENFIERAVILTSGPELQAPLAELGASISVVAANGDEPSSRPVTLEDAERVHIEATLKQTKGVIGGKGGAAEILGLPISTLRNRMKKLGLK
ncbi:MAG: hypothetical protein C5B55_01390 [Blastocatellia bacterium]|nr:MAG: hypothetical protein C5B55_01390 [Blastocatellia bacterium]